MNVVLMDEICSFLTKKLAYNIALWTKEGIEKRIAPLEQKPEVYMKVFGYLTENEPICGSRIDEIKSALSQMYDEDTTKGAIEQIIADMPKNIMIFDSAEKRY